MSTIKELIDQIQEDFLDDTKGSDRHRLWSPRNIAHALTQSQREIARRTLMLQDSTTNEVCFLNLVQDPVTGLYPQTIPLSSKVLRVRFCLFPRLAETLSSPPDFIGRYELRRTTTEFMNNEHRDGYNGHGRDSWIGRHGHVERFMTDFQRQSLTFDRVPRYAGTVQIGVYRLPLQDLSHLRPDDEPEINEYDLALIHGALKYLYSKGVKREDSETHDPIKESRWRNEFEADIKTIFQDLAAMQPKETVCHPERGAW